MVDEVDRFSANEAAVIRGYKICPWLNWIAASGGQKSLELWLKDVLRMHPLTPPYSHKCKCKKQGMRICRCYGIGWGLEPAQNSLELRVQVQVILFEVSLQLFVTQHLTYITTTRCKRCGGEMVCGSTKAICAPLLRASTHTHIHTHTYLGDFDPNPSTHLRDFDPTPSTYLRDFDPTPSTRTHPATHPPA